MRVRLLLEMIRLVARDHHVAPQNGAPLGHQRLGKATDEVATRRYGAHRQEPQGEDEDPNECYRAPVHETTRDKLHREFAALQKEEIEKFRTTS